NVPIGTKTTITFPDDDFEAVSASLSRATLLCCDFEETISMAGEADILFVDPPYTTAHNFNGFVKYNETLFSWDDQKQLRNCCARAAQRGAIVIISNADHPSLWELYEDISVVQ